MEERDFLTEMHRVAATAWEEAEAIDHLDAALAADLAPPRAPRPVTRRHRRLLFWSNILPAPVARTRSGWRVTWPLGYRQRCREALAQLDTALPPLPTMRALVITLTLTTPDPLIPHPAALGWLVLWALDIPATAVTALTVSIQTTPGYPALDVRIEQEDM